MIDMKKPSVTVVVLNYKGWKDTVNCIDSLTKQTYDNFHIFLIDNGSHDESTTELAKLNDPRLTFVVNETNTGFTGGVNQGIEWTIERGDDAVALLNNDAVVEADWLEELIDA